MAPNEYVFTTIENFLDDTNIRGVNLFASNNGNKINKVPIYLSKAQFVSMLEDIAAYRWIIFGHPMMNHNFRKKMPVVDGIIHDTTMASYMVSKTGLCSYLRLKDLTPKEPYDDEDYEYMISSAHDALCNIGGSTQLLNMRQAMIDHQHLCSKMRHLNPMCPQQDTHNLYNWQIVRPGTYPEYSPVSQISSYNEDDETIFWARKRNANEE